MNFDLLAAIELTVSAGVVVAVLAIGFGQTAARRIGLALGLGAWFAAVTILASVEAFQSAYRFGTLGLGLAVALPIATLWLAVGRSPRLRRALETIPMSLLVGVNVVRVLGVIFLLLYAAERLPGPFAPVAGWGDIIAGATALPVAWIAHRRGTDARPVLFAWNTFGLADLVTAVGLGVASSPGPLHLINAEPAASLMTTLPFLLIPGFLVPLLVSTHLAVFYRLRRAGRPTAVNAS